MNRIKNVARLILVSAIVALMAGCGGSGGGRFAYSDFIVFGASLSDTGNVYTATNGSAPGASPSYYLGRWSNGPLWIENVAESYGKDVKAALLGGGTTHTVMQKLARFQGSHLVFLICAIRLINT